jgi:hypothetical protein
LAVSGTFSPMLMLMGFFVFVAGQQELAAVRFKAAQHARDTATGPAFLEEVWPSGNEPAIDPGFSGFIWDGRARAWVLWQHGRPVQTFWVE